MTLQSGSDTRQAEPLLSRKQRDSSPGFNDPLVFFGAQKFLMRRAEFLANMIDYLFQTKVEIMPRDPLIRCQMAANCLLAIGAKTTDHLQNSTHRNHDHFHRDCTFWPLSMCQVDP